MKKLFSLFAAVLFAGSMVATVVTLDPAKHEAIAPVSSSTGTDINITMEGIGIVYNGSLNAATDGAPADFRVFGGKTLTLSAASNISKVVIAGKANKAGWAPSVTAGSITTGASYDGVMTKADLNDPLFVVENINANSITITCNKQLRAYKIQVTLDGEGGEGGEGTYTYDENSDFNGTFDTYTIDDTYLQEYGSIYVEAQDDNNNYIILDITLPENASGLVAGTYNVVVVENDEYPYQSVTAGFYYDDEEEGGIYPSYAAVVSADGQSLENVWYIVSGTVVVDENLAITVNAKNSLGKNVMAVLGEAGEEGYSYTGDEEEASFDVNFAKYTIDDMYLEKYGSIYVEAQDDNNNYIILDITLPENASGLVAGTYNVVVIENDEYPYQSVTAGFYYDDEEEGGIYPSYAAVVSADGQSLENVWYIVSGTVVVDENLAITVNAKNSLGKTVKAVLAEEDAPETAVENANATVKAVKTLENGMIIIERNGMRHNVIGQVVR